MKKIAVVIPCYNEEDAIGKVIAELTALPADPRFSVTPVVINDCSKDNTLKVLKQLNCTYLDLPVNLGIGGAVQSGFKYALLHGFDIAIQLDGDGQHPSEQIALLVTPILDEGANIVIGSRFIEKEGFQSTYLRRSGINYFKRLNKMLTGLTVTDTTSGFRAIDRKTLEVVCKYYPDEYPEPEALILYALNGLYIKEIPVVMRERQGGVSSIGSYKSIYYMIKVTLAMLFIYLRLKFNGKRRTF
ncbi:MAG: glycosyl transferase family 2 [Bacteroidetes bacterium]|jgi:glycosyltransferase involved in cell wall biosynthesis|nr:glycosyl transferase family 2 [Bacteroidota bacterium]